jgi:hypothetical protein
VECQTSALLYSGREEKMELVTHKKLKGGRLMPWGKAGSIGRVNEYGNVNSLWHYVVQEPQSLGHYLGDKKN